MRFPARALIPVTRVVEVTLDTVEIGMDQGSLAIVQRLCDFMCLFPVSSTRQPQGWKRLSMRVCVAVDEIRQCHGVLPAGSQMRLHGDPLQAVLLCVR